MKRSEFYAKRRENYEVGDDVGRSAWAEGDCVIAEEAGVKWDPEEPEPALVEVGNNGRIDFERRPIGYFYEDDLSLGRSIIAAYNRLRGAELAKKALINAYDCLQGRQNHDDGFRVAAEVFGRRIKEAMEYLDPSDTVYRILNGEEP